MAGAPRVRHTRSHLAQKQNKTRLVLTEGWNWGKDRRRVLTAKSGGGAPGCTRTGRCGDSPGPWIPWIVAWSPCRGATGVRRHRADPEAWKFLEIGSPAAKVQVKIPALGVAQPRS